MRTGQMPVPVPSAFFCVLVFFAPENTMQQGSIQPHEEIGRVSIKQPFKKLSIESIGNNHQF